jgi:hypothetical protein
VLIVITAIIYVHLKERKELPVLEEVLEAKPDLLCQDNRVITLVHGGDCCAHVGTEHEQASETTN